VKPVAMIADALRDCSQRGGVVLDADRGAAHRAARPAGRDRSGLCRPHHPALTRDDAALFATGESFAERERRARTQDTAPAPDTTDPSGEVAR